MLFLQTATWSFIVDIMTKMQLILSFFLSLTTLACGASLDKYSNPGNSQQGYAVYYSDKLHGNTTASGEMYNKNQLTAAHKSLPFGTIIRVTNLSNRHHVELKINDRGPFKKPIIIDLSKKAATMLDMIKAGKVEVKIEVVSIP